MKALQRVERDHLRKRIPKFRVGDTVKVHVKVIEGEKVRTQIFRGTVIGRRGGGIRETFTVRKITANIAVERIFPLHSPSLIKVERVRTGKVRRAQLTYMKTRKGKAARISGRRVSDGEKAADGAEPPAAAAPPEPPEPTAAPEATEPEAEGAAAP